MLTRFFTQNNLQGLSSADSYSYDLFHKIVIRYQISVKEEVYNETIISEIYHYLSKSYRNEYFYKNTLLNKLIINVHRVNTTTALTEVPIAKSKADFIMINGKAVVYEIKTELDTFERLSTQIADYYKAFDHVCVVTSEKQLPELLEKLSDSTVGIYVLTKKNTIKRVKEPQENRAQLDGDYMFKILNKPEYESIVRITQGSLPEVTPVNYYKECKRILMNLQIDDFYDLFLKELKKRTRIQIKDYSEIPEAFRFLIYFSKNQKKNVKGLQKFLASKFNGG